MTDPQHFCVKASSHEPQTLCLNSTLASYSFKFPTIIPSPSDENTTSFLFRGYDEDRLRHSLERHVEEDGGTFGDPNWGLGLGLWDEGFESIGSRGLGFGLEA